MRGTARVGSRRLLGILLTAPLLNLAACDRETPPEPLPQAVRVQVLEAEEVEQAAIYSGTVRAAREVDLSFKVPGTVAGLLQVEGRAGTNRDVQEGDRVLANQPLAWLDEADYERSVQLRTARLEELRARLEAARAQTEYLKNEYQRTGQLYRQSAAASQELEKDESAYKVSLAQQGATEREAAAAAVALRQAEDDLANCRLNAPFADAVVASRVVETGERVEAGGVVFTLLDVSKVKVGFGVPDTMVSRLVLGRPVEILSDAFPDRTLPGHLSQIAPAADNATRTFPIEVTLDDPGPLRPGMVATVRIGSRESLYRIPPGAIQQPAGADEPVVFTVATVDGKAVARQRPVLVEGLSEDRVRILVGPETEIQPGDQIVVSGADRLRDGEVVRVLGSLDALLPRIATIR